MYINIIIIVKLLTVRLSERMGDIGKGKLEIFHPENQSWQPACVTHWDSGSSANYICSQMGYM